MVAKGVLSLCESLIGPFFLTYVDSIVFILFTDYIFMHSQNLKNSSIMLERTASHTGGHYPDMDSGVPRHDCRARNGRITPQNKECLEFGFANNFKRFSRHPRNR